MRFSKKGFSFFYFAPFFVLIVVMTFSFFSSSKASLPEKTDFGVLTTTAYNYAGSLSFEHEYVQTLLSTYTVTFKTDFFKSILDNRERSDKCLYVSSKGSEQLWYNEELFATDEKGARVEQNSLCRP